MSAPDVEAILREHRLMYDVLNWTCRCGERYRATDVKRTGLTTVQDFHDAHVAAIIAAAYAETLAGVRAEVWGEGYLRGTLDATSDLEPADNPHQIEGA